MKPRLILATLFVLLSNVTIAQTIIFSESMGTATSAKAISVHEFDNGFDNPDLSMTDGGAVNPADIRGTSPYQNITNNANVWFSGNTGEYGFAIENIDASGYSGLTLQFDYRKENTPSHAAFAVQYWNGSAWENIANTAAALFNEAASATAMWYLSKIIALPTAAQVSNLKLRFVKTGGVAIRIDNIFLKGSNTCAPASNIITPTSGPAGTIVTVTATSSNLIGATATVGGVSAAVTQISSTQIQVTIPAGAQTGALVTTIGGGCNVSNPFTVINSVITSCQGSGSARNKVFISEVTDHGTGGHSYIELYNATGSTINLLNYKVNIHNNGATSATSSITLPSYNLANNTAYLIGIGGTDATTQYASVVANITSGVGGVNGNDHIRLLDNTGTWIDLWGTTSNTNFTIATKNYFYRRKNAGITAPSTTWNANDWTSGVPVNYDDIGLYDYSVGVPPVVNIQPVFTPSCLTSTLSLTASEGFVGGNALAYQWYYAAPNATIWTAIPATAPFSNVNTATLLISDISGLDNYQFYAQVRENTSTCFTATRATMVRISNSVWNGTSWTPATTPTSASLVRITGNYNTTTNGNLDACSVVVTNGATLRISPSNYVSIENNLEVQSGGILIVESDGSLVMQRNTGTVTNNGTLQVKRTTTAYKKFDYTYWSSPVTAANITTTFSGWRLDYGFSFNTANYTDVNNDGFDDDNNSWIPIPNNTVATKGVGYAIMMPTVSVPSFPAPGTTVTFSGAVNNGIINVPVVLSSNTQPSTYDFNLIGNPYPSAVDGTLLIQNNATLNTLYFWTHRTAIANATPGPNTYNYVVDDYATYNLSGGVASASGSAPPSGKIASGQGFFAEVDAAGTVQFRNEYRSKLFANNDFYRQVTSERDRIWLNFENTDGLFSQQLIGYFNEATNAVDRGYDGATLASQNSVSFYSLLDSSNYRIQGRAPFTITDEVPLGFKAVQGTFKISIPFIEGQLAALDAVYLEDKQLGIIHNLKAFPYNFSTNAGVFNNRFVLKYTTESLAISDVNIDSELVMITNYNQISIKSTNEMANVQLFDMLGRLVYESDIESTYFTTSLLATNGVLIAKVLFKNGQRVDRKIQL